MQRRADRGDRRAVRALDPRLLHRLAEEALEHLDAAVHAEVVRRAQRPAHEREHLAVGRDEREIGLRVAAVDGEDDRCGHADGLPPGLRQALGLGFEQALDELLVQRVLADQRMCEQRLARDRAVAGHSRLDGEPLVGGDVLGEPEQLRCERLLRQRHDPAVLNARRHLDDVVVGEAGEHAVVPDVDLVHGVVAADERSDEAGRGLAVERAATLLEQGGLLVQRRVAVELEQPALDLGDDLGARHSAELLCELRVVAVEVVEVGGGDDAELVEQLPRQVACSAIASPCEAISSGSTSRPSTCTARIHVRWLSPTWSTIDLGRARRRGDARTSAGSRSRRCRGRRRGGRRRAATG